MNSQAGDARPRAGRLVFDRPSPHRPGSGGSPAGMQCRPWPQVQLQAPASPSHPLLLHGRGVVWHSCFIALFATFTPSYQATAHAHGLTHSAHVPPLAQIMRLNESPLFLQLSTAVVKAGQGLSLPSIYESITEVRCDEALSKYMFRV